MKNSLFFLLIGVIALVTGCNNSKKTKSIMVEYPKTEIDTVVDEYFGTNVVDPFRWLEDDNSEKTKDWVIEQNKVTHEYLSQIPFRDSVRNHLNNMANYERYGLPFKKNNKYYYFKNSGLQNQSVMYVADSKDDEGKVFLDPNTFSDDGTTAVGELGFTKDGNFLGYTLSEAGADWQKIVFINVLTGETLNDTIDDVKFTGIVWYKNEGILYSRYDKPEDGSVLSAMTMHHKVYYHKLGTEQSDDILVFGKNIKRRYVGAQIFNKSDYMFVSAAEGTSGNELYFTNGITGAFNFTPIVDNFDNDHVLVHAIGDEFYILTNLNSPNKRIVKANIKNPKASSWIDIIPEKEEPIEEVSFAGNFLFVTYLKDAASKVYQFDLDGKLVREVKLPSIGTVFGFKGEGDDEEIFYGFQSFISPTTIFSYYIEEGETKVFRSPEINADLSQYETKQVFFESKDGTKVPMFIVYRKGINLDASNPTLLYGYGGFNISLTPSFSFRWSGWLDMGGVFALVNLRGGGEYGEEWHLAGTKMQKQNVFDDFIAAAEYLQLKGYTSNEKLTIMGGSNGGLLVGAVTNQRPELFKVALPAVGVMDMLRFHKFTAGAGWIADYGSADNSKAMFDYLYAYSPVHNVKEGVNYPAVMVTTADHDDRVVPAHSFKYIAQLQTKQTGTNPVLIRIETKAGHGAGKSTSKYLDELADIYSFAFYNMNESPVYFQK